MYVMLDDRREIRLNVRQKESIDAGKGGKKVVKIHLKKKVQLALHNHAIRQGNSGKI